MNTHIVSHYPDNAAIVAGQPSFERIVSEAERVSYVVDRIRQTGITGFLGVRAYPEEIAGRMARAQAI